MPPRPRRPIRRAAGRPATMARPRSSPPYVAGPYPQGLSAALRLPPVEIARRAPRGRPAGLSRCAGRPAARRPVSKASRVRAGRATGAPLRLGRGSVPVSRRRPAARTASRARSQQVGALPQVLDDRESRRRHWPRTGKRCSSFSQKAWMVRILRPPGVSTVRANRRRAASISPRSARGGGAPVATMAASRAGPSSRVQRASSSNTRIDMLAAAALVKVRHRIRPGGTPASSSRSTRWARTCVLPEPAFAETQAEVPGSEARRWRASVSAGILRASRVPPVTPPPPRRHPSPTIP